MLGWGLRDESGTTLLLICRRWLHSREGCSSSRSKPRSSSSEFDFIRTEGCCTSLGSADWESSMPPRDDDATTSRTTTAYADADLSILTIAMSMRIGRIGRG